MKKISQQNLNNNIIVCLLFIFLFIIQWNLINSFQTLNISFAASLIYLPHGLRVLATLIGGVKIIPGLLLGHILTGFFLHLNSVNLEFNYFELEEIINLKNLIIIVLTSLGGAFSVIISMATLRFNPKKIKDISLKIIIQISILSAIINSFVSNAIYYLSFEAWKIGLQFLQFIIGDIIGALVIFYFVKFLNNYLSEKYKN